ncbi:MAG TPA: YicC family protein [Phycisphaerales bacterium]|nr:YicC family protein [Phycisphaerales bacterium]
MIKSMTGFGDASDQIDGMKYFIEIKTVNNRYLKTSVKVSEVAAFMTDEIDKLLRSCINRGTVNFSLKIQSASDQGLFDIDENTIQAYIKKLTTIAEQNNIDTRIDITSLLTIPGVIQPALPDEQQAEKVRESVITMTQQALEKLDLMRTQEGKTLADDLIANCDAIAQKLDIICQKSPLVVQEYHDKLKKKVDDLLAAARLELDSETLAREVAIFAEKCDIAEEITRLNSHLAQFKAFCKENTNSGRKLDFVTQEMLREANTIASKASNELICQSVIDIKCSIDRIKEQVQNIE